MKNESGKSAKQLRKRTAAPQLVDDPQDEALDGDGFPCKPPSNSIVDEGEIEYDYRVYEDHENGVENASTSERASNKSKKTVDELERKPARRRRRDSGQSEQSNQQPRKKFSHSTCRKNRCEFQYYKLFNSKDYGFLSLCFLISFFYAVKVLLSIPEDEIDFQKMPFKDIILLAGQKERLAVCTLFPSFCGDIIFEIIGILFMVAF